jgi:hypothetical protein
LPLLHQMPLSPADRHTIVGPEKTVQPEHVLGLPLVATVPTKSCDRTTKILGAGVVGLEAVQIVL